MKKVIPVILLIALLATCVFVSVKNKNYNTDEEFTQRPELAVVDNHSDDGRIIVGISMPDRLLERWNHDGTYLRAQFEKNGCEVFLRYANNLIDTQMNDILTMIDNGADLLVIAAVDGAAITPVLEIARSSNVPVIAYDRLIMDTDVVNYYVSFDNYKVGVLQAEYLIDALRLNHSARTRNIEFVTGDPVDNNARYFYNGAMDTLRPYLENGKLKVLSGQTSFYETSTSQWSTDLSQQRLQIILNSYYPNNARLDAVLCANDSTALGAVRALESDYNGSNTVYVTGQDCDVANVYNIIDGSQGMSVFKALQQESVVTVALGLSLLEGNTPGEDFISQSNWAFNCSYNTTDYFNGTKIVTSYLLEPIPITSKNIEKELFDNGYYRRNSAGLIYSAK